MIAVIAVAAAPLAPQHAVQEQSERALPQHRRAAGRSHAVMAAEKLTVFGTTRRARIAPSSASARAHCSPCAHAEIAALYGTASSARPSEGTRASSSSSSARAHVPPLSHANIADT